MTMRIPTTRLGAEEAVTATQRIKTVLEELTAELGEEAVTTEVIDAFKELDDAAQPLRSMHKLASSTERREVDSAADRVWSAIYATCESRIEAYGQQITPLTDAEQTELEACELIVAALFPLGTSPLRSRFTQQYGWTEINLNQLRRRNVTEAIELVGLKNLVNLAKRLHVEYGQRMGFTEAETLDPLTAWHETLEAFVATVIVRQRGSDLRDQITAPYEEIAQSSRDASKPKKKDNIEEEGGE